MTGHSFSVITNCVQRKNGREPQLGCVTVEKGVAAAATASKKKYYFFMRSSFFSSFFGPPPPPPFLRGGGGEGGWGGGVGGLRVGGKGAGFRARRMH